MLQVAKYRRRQWGASRQAYAFSPSPLCPRARYAVADYRGGNVPGPDEICQAKRDRRHVGKFSELNSLTFAKRARVASLPNLVQRNS